MKKTKQLFDLQLKWLQTKYNSSMKNTQDRFMTNAFFYLSNLENNIVQNIDDVNTLFEALEIYDDFCITTILQNELKNYSVKIRDNLWGLFNDALTGFYGNNLAKKNEVRNNLAILIIDAQLQFIDKHEMNCTTLNKQFDDYINELFSEYKYDYKYKKTNNLTKPCDGYESLLFEIINSYRMNDNDLTIVTSEQRYSVKLFNMSDTLQASQTIALFTFIHLFKITGGQIEKIEKLVANFQKEYNSPYRFQQEIVLAIGNLIKKISGLIVDKNEVIHSNNDYSKKVIELEEKRKKLSEEYDKSIKNTEAASYADNTNNVDIESLKKAKTKALKKFKLSAKEIEILMHQSTHNQNALNATYWYVLEELKYEYYGELESLIDTSKLLSAFPYLEKIQSYHDAYVLITDGIFIDPKQSKAMHGMEHNFSFLYKCTDEYPYGDKEEYIFSEYASALSSGWMLQAIISNFSRVGDQEKKSILANNEYFRELFELKDYAYCYPLAYLYNLEKIEIGTALKVAKKHIGQLTQQHSLNSDSFKKNFRILCDLLKDFNIHDFCRENARYIFATNL